VRCIFADPARTCSSRRQAVSMSCAAPHYPWQFPKERLIARLLHERTRAPVSWPYLLDPSDDIFGWSYALMPRLPGL